MVDHLCLSLFNQSDPAAFPVTLLAIGQAGGITGSSLTGNRNFRMAQCFLQHFGTYRTSLCGGTGRCITGSMVRHLDNGCAVVTDHGILAGQICFILRRRTTGFGAVLVTLDHPYAIFIDIGRTVIGVDIAGQGITTVTIFQQCASNGDLIVIYLLGITGGNGLEEFRLFLFGRHNNFTIAFRADIGTAGRIAVFIDHTGGPDVACADINRAVDHDLCVNQIGRITGGCPGIRSAGCIVQRLYLITVACTNKTALSGFPGRSTAVGIRPLGLVKQIEIDTVMQGTIGAVLDNDLGTGQQDDILGNRQIAAVHMDRDIAVNGQLINGRVDGGITAKCT